MLNVMIERASFGISLVKIFGYCIEIMLIYFAVNGLLTAKLKRITPAEVLKSRE